MAFAKIKPVPVEYSSNAVIYARYSSDKQTENSIDGQLRICREYCESKGLKVVGEYIDRAMSGTDDNRPDFQKMIRDAEKQKFAFVIVYRFDRFMRNRYDSAIYKKKLEQVGVRVLSTAEQIGDGDEGIILESIYEAMDEAYSRRLSRIVKRGMRETAEKGLWTGGNIPLGLKVEGRRLVLDEPNARCIRMMGDLILEGKTPAQTARILKAHGFKTRNGKDWTAANVPATLRRRIYCGDYTFIDPVQGNIPRRCPAIIDEEKFNRIQAKLDANKKFYGRKTTEEVDFMLTGKIFCGHCGSVMVGDSGTSHSGKKYHYYSCSKKKKRVNNCTKKAEKKDFIEWYICEQTVEYVLSEESITEIAKRVYQEAKNGIDSQRIKELEEELKKINRDVEAGVETLLNLKSQLAIDKLNAKFEALEKQKASAEAELEELYFKESLILTEEEIKQFLKTFVGGDLLDPEYRRRLIRAFVNCVYLFDDKIVIYYNVQGGKQINHLDVIDFLDELSCSDSVCQGGTFEHLSEHFRLIFQSGTFGIVIGRD